jgi:hypothetical protein
LDKNNYYEQNKIIQHHSPLVWVNLSLLADKVCESATNTLDLGKCKHGLAATIDICVQHTKNVLKIRTHHKCGL